MINNLIGILSTCNNVNDVRAVMKLTNFMLSETIFNLYIHTCTDLQVLQTIVIIIIIYILECSKKAVKKLKGCVKFCYFPQKTFANQH